MILRRSFSTLTRVLRASNKAGAPPASSSSANGKKVTKKESTASQSALNKSEPAAAVNSKAKVENEEPFDNSGYKTLEYFSHDKFSFADVMVELANKRLPQKSNRVKETV